MKIVILGARGFVGGWLFREFSDFFKQEQVIGFSRDECDLLSLESTRLAFGCLGDQDVVIMTSAISRLQENSYSAMVRNVEMANQLCRVVTERRCSQVVFLSSIDVYGSERGEEQGCKITEHSPLFPNDYYSLSKVTSEFLLRNAAREWGIPLTILRLPGLFGPGDSGKSLVSLFIEQGRKNGEIRINGEGKELRNYIYVEDVVHVIREVVERRLEKVLNVVAPRSYSIVEIAGFVKETFCPDAKIIHDASAGLKKRGRDIVFDDRELREIFLNVAMHDLRSGIGMYGDRVRGGLCL